MSKLIVANCPATVREYSERLSVGAIPRISETRKYTRVLIADKRDPRHSTLKLRFSEIGGRK